MTYGPLEDAMRYYITDRDLEEWEKNKPKIRSRAAAIIEAKARGWTIIKDSTCALASDPILFRSWRCLVNDEHRCIVYAPVDEWPDLKMPNGKPFKKPVLTKIKEYFINTIMTH